jgi:hypothetical protein
LSGAPVTKLKGLITLIPGRLEVQSFATEFIVKKDKAKTIKRFPRIFHQEKKSTLC